MTALKKISKLLTVGILTVLLNSCGGVNLAGASKSPSNKLSESFFIGNGVSQYHIKSQELTSNYDDSENSFDMTFRTNEPGNTKCNINLTVIANFKIIKDTNFEIISNNETLAASKTGIIYIEKSNGKTINRINTSIEYGSFLKAINSSSFEFKIFNETNLITLKPTKKSLKNIEKLKQSFLN